jgi:hypothetical protein
LTELNELAKESKETSDLQKLESILDRSQAFTRYEGDADFREPLTAIEERVREKQRAEALSATIPLIPAPAASPMDAPEAPASLKPPEAKLSVKIGSGGKTVFALPKWGWAGITFLAVALLIWGVNRFVSQRSARLEAVKRTSISIPLHVNGAAPGEFRVTEDSTGAPVENPETGLKAGSYTLTASRAGFEPVLIAFEVNPDTDSEKSIEVHWRVLPVNVKIKVPPAGMLKVDGMDQVGDSAGEFATSWRPGAHTISWEGVSGSVQLDLEMTDSMVGVKQDPMVQGKVFGIVGITGQSALTYQAVNIPGGIVKTVDGKNEAVTSKDTISIPSGQTVGLKVKYGLFPLGDFSASTTGAPVVYVSFYLPPPPAGKRGPVTSKSEDSTQKGQPADDAQRLKEEKEKQDRDRAEKEKKDQEKRDQEKAQEIKDRFNGVKR